MFCVMQCDEKYLKQDKSIKIWFSGTFSKIFTAAGVTDIEVEANWDVYTYIFKVNTIKQIKKKMTTELDN